MNQISLRKFCELINFPEITERQLDLLTWLFAEPGEIVESPLNLPPAQPEALMLCGRGMGKTTLACLYALAAAIANDNEEIIVCANSLTTSYDVLLSKLRELVTPIRTMLREGFDSLSSGTTKRRLVFTTGSTITIVTNIAHSIRGRGPRIALLDEVQSWPWSRTEEKDLGSFLNALRPRQIVDHGNARKIILTGTPSIQAGPFFEIWTNQPPDLSAVQLPTYAVRTDIPAERFEILRRQDPRLFSIEIEAQWGATEESIIDLCRLDACMRDPEHIPQPTENQVIGIDVGFKHDFTGFAAASKDPNSEVYYIHYLDREKYKGNVEVFLSRAKKIHMEWPEALILLDQFHGLSLQELLRRENIEPTEVIYWHSGNRSATLDYFATLVHDGKIVLPKSDALRQECASLKEKITASGQRRIEHTSKRHDDLLFAILLCVEKLRTRMAYMEPVFWGN